jgi:hypothetical protein
MRQLLSTIILFVLAFASSAQITRSELTRLITEKDSIFWVRYNVCDVPGMMEFMSDDVEFYHDKGGAMKLKTNVFPAFEKRLCGNPDSRLRRVAVDGTVAVYPLFNKDTAYGAIISGDHLFYVTQKGKKEFLDGHAKFSQLWTLQADGAWKMSRILSYDHKDANPNILKRAVYIPEASLRKLVGTYKGTNNIVSHVTVEDGQLVVRSNNKTFVLHAESATKFFSKDADVSFEVVKDGGKQKRLTVTSGGKKVDEITRQ